MHRVFDKRKPKPKRLKKEKVSELKVRDINILKKGEDVLDESGNLKFKNTDYTLPAKNPEAMHIVLTPNIMRI